MIKRLNKRVYATVLTIAMAIGMLNPVTIKAAATPVEINDDSRYVLVSTENNKAVNVSKPGWTTHTTVYGAYVEDGNKVNQNSLLKIVKTADQNGLAADEVRVNIYSVGLDDQYPIRSEGDNTYVFADSDKRTDQCEYIIKATGTNTGTIRDTNKGKYFGIDSSNGEILRVDENQALEFKFLENPAVVDFTYYIEHKASGKYVRMTGEAVTPLLVDGVKENDIIGDDLRYDVRFGKFNDLDVINFKSKKFDLCWNSGSSEIVTQQAGDICGGWESIAYQPNGDGTISFMSSVDQKIITVNSNDQMIRSDIKELTDNEKFIIHSEMTPNPVTDVTVKVSDSDATVSWKAPVNQVVSGYQVVATPANVGTGKTEIKSAITTDTKMVIEGLASGTEYLFKVVTILAEDNFGYSKEISAQTKNGPAPVQPIELKTLQDGENIKISWAKVNNADSYDVYRAVSAFASYEKIAGDITDNFYLDKNTNENKYSNYYKIVAKNANGESPLSDEYSSLETTIFGKNMIIFAETDPVDKIDQVVQEIFLKQNDITTDAQFNSGHYAIYYKPGNYVNTQCIPVGFYTHIGGLGKTPYEVKLNNIEVPAYLDGSATSDNHWADTGEWRNATCNFWRSAENISVVGEGDASVADKLSASTDNSKKDYFNWSVAQAAPLRRVYSTRKVSYDWAFGWASGGYTADSYFESDAGTASGQQYFTRNTVIKGSGTGTTLNNFNIGVDSASLPDSKNGTALVQGNGYTDWAENGVTTNITTTPQSKEKPFLFIDDGEYKVFVPALKENTSGISWSKDDMGEGETLSLDEFFIAHDSNTAAEINEQLEAGKNIFFTPGIYHAEEVIKVNNPDTILLGTGMATIIPDNEEAAMEVADVDGVTIAGLIFDAGKHSQYLLKVGESGADKDHSDNPTVLQDLFFRIGGTTSELTKADIALEINSNDVIGDHFWIWRADHGAGVEWYGNESYHGVIVNGDNVTCYALFNEHFNKYDTLWNGEKGATYFYQNEKCYDPISQSAWMSHEGLSNGYSAYKVSNKVKEHYAVGLGIYNVFIYTGPTYDSSEVQIQLDNPIEVPNAEMVLVENACTQTFAKADGALQKFNKIINDCGESVSSGIDKVTGEKGEGWSRKYILNYQNGVCNRGTVQDPVVENGLNPYNEKGDVNIEELILAYEACDDKLTSGDVYTEETFNQYKKIMDEIKPIYDNFKQEQAGGAYIPNRLTQDEVDDKAAQIKAAYNALEFSSANYNDLDKAIDEAKRIMKTTDYTSLFYTKESKEIFDNAYKAAKKLADDRDNNPLLASDQDKIDEAAKKLWDSINGLTIKDADLKPLKIAIERANKIIASDNYQNGNYVEATKEIFDYYYNLGKELYETEGLDARNQALIEARAANIHNGVDQLLLMPANIGDLEELIKFAEVKIRDGEYFQNEYYINVAKFLDYLQQARNVIKDADITDQDKIDQTYQDLWNAINSLELKPADYEELNALRQQALQIIAGENYINNRYTTETVAVFNTVHANAKMFSDAYMIPDQAVVDQQAKELDKAIKGLRLKTDEPQKPVIPDDQTPNDETANQPVKTPDNSKVNNYKVAKTGDEKIVEGYVMLGILAVGGLAVLKKRRIHR